MSTQNKVGGISEVEESERPLCRGTMKRGPWTPENDARVNSGILIGFTEYQWEIQSYGFS